MDDSSVLPAAAGRGGKQTQPPMPFGVESTRTSLQGNPDILASEESQKRATPHQIHGHKPGRIQIACLGHGHAGPKASALAPACSSCGRQRAPVPPLTGLPLLLLGSRVKAKTSRPFCPLSALTSCPLPLLTLLRSHWPPHCSSHTLMSATPGPLDRLFLCWIALPHTHS